MKPYEKLQKTYGKRRKADLSDILDAGVDKNSPPSLVESDQDRVEVDEANCKDQIPTPVGLKKRDDSPHRSSDSSDQDSANILELGIKSCSDYPDSEQDTCPKINVKKLQDVATGSIIEVIDEMMEDDNEREEESEHSIDGKGKDPDKKQHENSKGEKVDEPGSSIEESSDGEVDESVLLEERRRTLRSSSNEDTEKQPAQKGMIEKDDETSEESSNEEICESVLREQRMRSLRSKPKTTRKRGRPKKRRARQRSTTRRSTRIKSVTTAPTRQPKDKSIGSKGTLRPRRAKGKMRTTLRKRNHDVKISRPSSRKRKNLPKLKSDFQVGCIVEALYDDAKWYDVEIVNRIDFYNLEVIWLEESQKFSQKIIGVMQYWDLRPKVKCPTLNKKDPVGSKLAQVLWKLRSMPIAWPFREPVDPEIAPDYKEIIKHPIDLLTMRNKLENGHYSDIKFFCADFQLVVSNCIEYNGRNSSIANLARSLRFKYRELMRHTFPRVRLELIDASYSPQKKLPTSRVEKYIAEIEKTRNVANPPPESSRGRPPKANRVVKGLQLDGVSLQKKVDSQKDSRKDSRKVCGNKHGKKASRKSLEIQESSPAPKASYISKTVSSSEMKIRRLKARVSKEDLDNQTLDLERKHLLAIGLLPANGTPSAACIARLRRLYASVVDDSYSKSNKNMTNKSSKNELTDSENSGSKDIPLRHLPKRNCKIAQQNSFAFEQAMDHWMKIAIERSKIEYAADPKMVQSINESQKKTKSLPPLRGPHIPEIGMRLSTKFDDGVRYSGRVATVGLLCKRPRIWRLLIKYDDGESLYDVFPDPERK